MSNSTGSYRSTTHNVMRASDRLPPEVRKALADAVRDWAPQPLLTAYMKRGMTGKELAKRVRQWDADEITKAEKRISKAMAR